MTHIATDSHGNQINIGNEFDCRIAAVEFAIANERDAFVSEVNADGDDMTAEIYAYPEIKEAVCEARDWLKTDNGDDDRLTADLADALDTFDNACDDGDIKAALAACVSLSYDWASGDRSGFEKLNALASR